MSIYQNSKINCITTQIRNLLNHTIILVQGASPGGKNWIRLDIVARLIIHLALTQDFCVGPDQGPLWWPTYLCDWPALPITSSVSPLSSLWVLWCQCHMVWPMHCDGCWTLSWYAVYYFRGAASWAWSLQGYWWYCWRRRCTWLPCWQHRARILLKSNG